MSESMDFNDGKYTVISDNGRLTALRNGEPWNRDITGDNLIYWMLVEAIRLKEERDASAAKLANVEGQLAAVERLRPMWAQGHSTDSVAAQVSAAALTSLWDLLGVGNQTSAVVKLKQLLCVSAERDALAAKLKELEGQEPVATYMGHRLAPEGTDEFWGVSKNRLAINAPLFARPVPAEPALAVWFGSMPESNGKTNWTAILHRRGDEPWKGITIERSEYKDRVRYEADRLRWLIGELEQEPDILAYDEDLTERRAAEPVNARLLEVARAALEALNCSGESDDPGHRCGHCDDYVDRNGVVRAALCDAISAAEAQQGEPVRLTRESVARAIWGVRREYEDRCDMELEDMGESHPVWDEADAVLAAAELTQTDPTWLTIEQARNAERYAYLRSQHEGSVAASFAVFAPEQPIGEFGPVGSMPGELDAAIDAAIRANGYKVED